MDTAGALEHQELMSEGKDLRLQRCSSLKSLPSRRNQRENDREHVAEKLQRRLPKFNQFSQNGVFGRDRWGTEIVIGDEILIRIDDDVFSAGFTEMRLLPLSSTRRLSHSMADSFIRRKLRSKIPSQPALPDREPV
jgi:hypothetical protein